MAWVRPHTYLLAGTIFFAAGGSCIETGVNPIDTEDRVDLALEVEPLVLHFGGVEHEVTEVLTLTVRNVGEGGLPIDVAIEGTSAFALVEPWTEVMLGAGENLDVDVQFTPSSVEHEALLRVTSPDLDEIPVLLAGNGLFPRLEVLPPRWEFGAAAVCNTESMEVELINRGDAPLVIPSVAPTGDGLAIELHEALPLTLEPAGHTTLEASFYAEQITSYGGVTWISTNDLGGDDIVPWSGWGEPLEISEYSDAYRQSDGPWDSADVLFYVDQSASMDDDRHRLIDAFALLAARLDDEEVEWQVIVATDDDGCANEGVIYAGDPYAGAAFTSAVWGPYGLLAESGLAIANNALSATGAGQCNEGFLRDHSKTLLVMVSDEADQSEATWADMVSAIQVKAPSAAVIAVVGPVPSGCETADPGTGYFEAAMATDGLAVSLCETDWTEDFDKVADMVGAPTDTFELSYVPDPDTIVVELDGVDTDAWIYDEELNAVVTDVMPTAGTYVQIDYRVSTEC